MPLYRIQREYSNWEEVTVEADSKEHAQKLAAEDYIWDNAYDVNTHNITGEFWLEDVESGESLSGELKVDPN
jgi:hypothetical protein